MRVSDDRYSRDRTRLDLALRFIQHAARTRTIRTWTGLTDDRIRKLYRSYFQQAGRACAQRPRGRSPQQAAFFVRSPRLQHEASMLASACDLLGGLARALSGLERPSVAQGVLLCQSYEAVRMLVPASRISFEHFVFLAAALARGDELRLAECSACGALLVTERVQLVAPRCVFCAAAPSVSAARGASKE